MAKEGHELEQMAAQVNGIENDPLTERIIGCAYEASNILGSGFAEKVYENSLAIELRALGLKVGQQNPIQVHFRGEMVGEYVADLLVEEKVLVELKASQGIEDEDVYYAQCLNYLRATALGTCLLLNFGRPELQVKRISWRKEWKRI